MIKVGNIRTFTPDGSIAIRVDRSSVLGNPFYMYNESQREAVCDRYEEYFSTTVKLRRKDFMDELHRIYVLSLEQDITLLCWCSPKRCHAETIKRYIESLCVEEE